MLAKKDPDAYKDHQALYDLRDQLIEESDRGLCLLAIGRLEVVLSDLLDKKMLGSKTFKRDLFNNNGPLSTLSSKIKMSYSLGLISRGYFSEIDNMRQIRNQFAHADQPLNFDSPKIAALCNKLKVFAAQTGRPNRTKFISTFLYIISGILTEVRRAAPFQEIEERLSPDSITNVDKIHHGIHNLLNPPNQKK